MKLIRSFPLLRSLRYRNYRLYFGGQTVSLIGTWMQQIAMSWLVYRMTNSPFLLGLVGFSQQIPSVIMPLAGVVIDRHDRRRILMITQSLSLLEALTLAILAYTGVIQVWHVVLLGMFLGLVNAFDMPGRQSFAVEMIENKEDLGNVIALNSALFNGARLIGPAVAGVIIAEYGETVCFFLNAISYGAVLLALMAMRVPPRPSAPTVRENSLRREFLDGLSYVRKTPAIRDVLLLICCFGFLGFSFHVLMPVLAKDVFHGGPRTLGLLVSAVGVGALVGTLSLASQKNFRHYNRIILAAEWVFGVALLALSFVERLWLAIPLVSLAGMGIISFLVAGNTILQTIVEEDKRGRVMSYYTLSMMITTPIGALLAGALADRIGAPYTMTVSAVLCLLAILLSSRRIWNMFP